MPAIPPNLIVGALQQAEQARNQGQYQQCGRIFEDLIRDIFILVPGVSLLKRNQVNVAGCEEVDLFFWNRPHNDGLYFLETPFIVECKNWQTPATSQVVANFKNTLVDRGCRDGILITASGITGTPGTLTEAYYEISRALNVGCRILVLERPQLEVMITTDDLVIALEKERGELAVNMTRVE
jgi:hypothetical protein